MPASWPGAVSGPLRDDSFFRKVFGNLRVQGTCPTVESNESSVRPNIPRPTFERPRCWFVQLRIVAIVVKYGTRAR